MSKSLTFGSTVVDIPVSADSPNWAPGVTEAFEAIAEVLESVAGAFDIPAQSISLDSSNPGVPNTSITAINFPTSNVRAFNMIYSVFRTTNSTTAYETGTIIGVYSPNNSVGSKWELSRDYVGDGKIAFNVTDLGQMQYTATAIAGSGHSGRLIFQAKAILQT